MHASEGLTALLVAVCCAPVCCPAGLQVSGIPAGVGADELQALLTDTAGLVVDRLDLTTPEGPANRDNLQVRGVGVRRFVGDI
jgi:hypothetical protein